MTAKRRNDTEPEANPIRSFRKDVEPRSHEDHEAVSVLQRWLGHLARALFSKRQSSGETPKPRSMLRALRDFVVNKIARVTPYRVGIVATVTGFAHLIHMIQRALSIVVLLTVPTFAR